MPQRNPSKTMILEKAMDYIMKLEQRNERLLQQNIELQSRLALLITAPDPASQTGRPGGLMQARVPGDQESPAEDEQHHIAHYTQDSSYPREGTRTHGRNMAGPRRRRQYRA
uniref:Uncharacterized protein n=1 Tax=Fusarium oxysporum (strain Fo5176) TaxID=660025 RepID=A0A0D2XT50_FUSOF